MRKSIRPRAYISKGTVAKARHRDKAIGKRHRGKSTLGWFYGVGAQRQGHRGKGIRARAQGQVLKCKR